MKSVFDLMNKWIAVKEGQVNIEYIVIDDFSSDNTYEIISKFMVSRMRENPNINVKWIRNSKNIGLAASSNRALEEARGKYIIRLDADDIFVIDNAIKLLYFTYANDYEAIYPACYEGETSIVQKPEINHHIGGTIFKTSALNALKFNDKLRNLEGYEFFKRAKDILKIGYFEKPVFIYTQHNDSMSKTNLALRAKTKQQIDSDWVNNG
jgi:glycosyltransferase involved in cell wall biosynthesis